MLSLMISLQRDMCRMFASSSRRRSTATRLENDQNRRPSSDRRTVLVIWRIYTNILTYRALIWSLYDSVTRTHPCIPNGNNRCRRKSPGSGVFSSPFPRTTRNGFVFIQANVLPLSEDAA